MEVIQKHSLLYADLQDRYTTLGELYTKKLYHELTVELEKFVNDPSCDKKDNFIELYNEFIKPIQGKLNQLKLATICAQITTQYNDRTQAISFLEILMEVGEKKLGQEAYLLCMFKIAALKLTLQDPAAQKQVKTVLEEQKEVVEGLVGADPMVHSYYYSAACQYYQIVGPAEQFYKNALMFLAYSPYESMKPQERIDFATNISLAALTGDGVFNFGEVLATPILSALQGTDKQWLSELLHAFNRGDIDKFNEIIGTHHADYDSQPALVNKRDYVKEKVALLALMELVFHRPSHERNIPFVDVAQATRLPLEQVEWLVMRAMSVKLIKGSIDQVEKMIRISWVQPRVLDKNQMAELRDRLTEWGKKVNQTLLYVEDQTPELFD